jgi:hypothetical protein
VVSDKGAIKVIERERLAYVGLKHDVFVNWLLPLDIWHY